MQPETVKIKGGPGEPDFIIINASDFDEASMKLYLEPKTKKESEPEEADAPSVEDLLKHTKAELVALAEEKGLTVVPDEMTKQQIAEVIVAAEEPAAA